MDFQKVDKGTTSCIPNQGQKPLILMSMVFTTVYYDHIFI